MVGFTSTEGNWRINYVAPDGNPIGEGLWKEFAEGKDK